MKAILFFLLYPLVLAATDRHYRIYVSSSDGINNTSCWTGPLPCVSLTLALQGAVHYNHSHTIVYLSPGIYILDTTGLDQQLQQLRDNISIIGITSGGSYEEVSITCLDGSSSHWLRDTVLQCVTVYQCGNVTVTCPEVLPQNYTDLYSTTSQLQDMCPSLNITTASMPCDSECLQFVASVIDCNNKSFTWRNDLNVCINGLPCHKVVNTDCYTADYEPWSCYEFCDEDIGTHQVNVTLSIATRGPLQISKNLTVTTECDQIVIQESSAVNCRPYYRQEVGMYYKVCTNCSDFCKCVQCDHYPLGLLVFVLIELLPITVMVLLIIVFNIHLTNGSINGLVFYAQLIHISLGYYYYLIEVDCDLRYISFPCNIFNLDFTLFLGNFYPLCISPATMSPLGAIFFWYAIALYPLILLLLFYGWIIMYDKGFRCVVLVTRPFHRCLARFWSMTKIEPSFIHSIASVYLLCFTQLVAISFKVLSFNYTGHSPTFFYDATLSYFHGVHGAAGFFAILVLLFLVFIPVLYIQLYPFKLFHKLLGYLHLNKQILISLGDVFTGPYKNGSENTYDYRFFAGLYLLARIIILFQFVYPNDAIVTSIIQAVCSSLLGVMILIFRPFQRNIHNFSEFIILAIVVSTNFPYYLFPVIISFNSLIFGVLLIYIIVRLHKMTWNCYHYCNQYSHSLTNTTEGEEEEDNQPLVIDDDWLPDRMENPQDYNEQHFSVTMDPFPDQRPLTTAPIATAVATYGSINNPQVLTTGTARSSGSRHIHHRQSLDTNESNF